MNLYRYWIHRRQLRQFYAGYNWAAGVLLRQDWHPDDLQNKVNLMPATPYHQGVRAALNAFQVLSARSKIRAV